MTDTDQQSSALVVDIAAIRERRAKVTRLLTAFTPSMIPNDSEFLRHATEDIDALLTLVESLTEDKKRCARYIETKLDNAIAGGVRRLVMLQEIIRMRDEQIYDLMHPEIKDE